MMKANQQRPKVYVFGGNSGVDLPNLVRVSLAEMDPAVLAELKAQLALPASLPAPPAVTPAQIAAVQEKIAWQLVKDAAPPPHERYLVRRGGFTHTATPCYGMHAPWWVLRTMADSWPNEADPVPMRDDDEWAALSATPTPGEGR